LYFKVITEVATEPLTLAEVKRHLRIYDDGYNDSQSETIITRSAGISTVTGDGVDIQGCEATVYVNVGSVAAGGKLDVTIYESDDNVTYTAWASGTFTQISAAGQSSKLYTGSKRYIKAVAVITVNTIIFGINVQILAGDPVSDTELSNLITRVREEAEECTRLALAPQTLEISIDAFPEEKDYINLDRPPLTSVTSVKTYSSTGVETTLTASTDYLVDTDSKPGRIVLPYNKSWPTNADYPVNPIRIKYVCGYTTCPQKIKDIMLQHIMLLYQYKTTSIPDAELQAIERRYNSYRVKWFGGEQG